MKSLKMSYDIVRYDTVNLQEPFNMYNPVKLKVDQSFLTFYLDIILQYTPSVWMLRLSADCRLLPH